MYNNNVVISQDEIPVLKFSTQEVGTLLIITNRFIRNIAFEARLYLPETSVSKRNKYEA